MNPFITVINKFTLKTKLVKTTQAFYLTKYIPIYQELQSQQDKSAKEITDLEGIAQAHYARSNRLQDELNYVQADHLELRRQLQDQGQALERGYKLEEALQDLKADIKAVRAHIKIPYRIAKFNLKVGSRRTTKSKNLVILVIILAVLIFVTLLYVGSTSSHIVVFIGKRKITWKNCLG